jgi:hypothetical protein
MNSTPDQLIDQVLQALRDTQAPDGLEQRVAARLARVAEARTLNPTTRTGDGVTPSFFSVIVNTVKTPRIWSAEARPYAFAATTLAVLITFSLISFTSHRKPITIARWNPLPASIEPQTSIQLTNLAPAQTTAQTRSNKRPQPTSSPTVTPTDPDTIALAETLAPSHPAPPMPLTAQEVLLFRATRRGQPIELAELDTMRESALRSLAEAHERSTIRRYIQGLLGPLAITQALDPTSPSPSSDEAQPTTASDPPSPPFSK